MCAAVCAAPLYPASSEDRLIYLLSQAQQIQELLAFLRKLSNSGLLQCVAAAAAGESCLTTTCLSLPVASNRAEGVQPLPKNSTQHYHVRVM